MYIIQERSHDIFVGEDISVQNKRRMIIKDGKITCINCVVTDAITKTNITITIIITTTTITVLKKWMIK
jgi:hypothetical protein